MNPSMIDAMSWAMAEVYGAVTDKLLVNLARHFKYTKRGNGGSFDYAAKKLAELGQVRRESVDIIMQYLSSADEMLRIVLESAIVNALKDCDPALRAAAQTGILGASGAAELAPNQMRAFQSFYRQGADKLNLVNTVMLESTEAAYQATVLDIASRVRRTQSILNSAAGEVVSGVSSWNTAMRDAVRQMVDNGLAGFIDHAGHRWRPEAYVAMDIRSTAFNTARAAVWERNEAYGNDLYQVSSHRGARPKCYPWQGLIISTSGRTGITYDLDGEQAVIHAESEIESFRYGGGLFGVNCGHYPIPFIQGFSKLRSKGQSPEDNAKTYAESQEQRRLERKVRDEKLQLDVMKAQGAPEDEIRAQKVRVRNASADVDAFCEQTGRTRHREREYLPKDVKWPEIGDDVQFPTETRERIMKYIQLGDLSAFEDNGIIQKSQTDWSTATFQTEAKFEHHAATHMAEFGYQSREEYLTGARALLSSPLSDTLEGFTGKDGFVFRYDTKGNAFAVGHPGGSISTYFRPVKGREYWDEQVKKYKP